MMEPKPNKTAFQSTYLREMLYPQVQKSLSDKSNQIKFLHESLIFLVLEHKKSNSLCTTRFQIMTKKLTNYERRVLA